MGDDVEVEVVLRDEQTCSHSADADCDFGNCGLVPRRLKAFRGTGGGIPSFSSPILASEMLHVAAVA